MTTVFPTALDDFANPAGKQSQAATRTHSEQHADLNDAVEALQRKVGVDDSAVQSSLDYRVALLEGEPDLPGLDSERVSYSPPFAGGVARTGEAKFAEVISVKDFGAAGDGVTDDTAAFAAAWAAACLLPFPRLYLPVGRYYMPNLPAGLTPVSNMEVFGDGMNASTIKFDAAVNIHLFAKASGTARASNITFRDFAIEGTHGDSGVYSMQSTYPFVLYSIDGLSVHRVKVSKSRMMGMAFRDCTGVSVTGCWVHHCAKDGINAADCSYVSVCNNRVEFTDDDSIAVHTQIYGTNDRGHVISGNLVRFAQGIKLLGAKTASITGNTLEFTMGQGITVESVDPASGGAEGINASNGVVVSGNTIKNCIDRAIVDGLNSSCPYIVIGGPSGKAGSLAAIPGENDTATGTIVSLYPYFENSQSGSTANPIPYNYNVVVANNVCVRDVAGSGLLSALGFGTLYTRNGPVDPTLTDAALRQYGVVVRNGILRNAVIRGNTFMGLAGALSLSASTRLLNSAFHGNTIYDCTSGIVCSGSNTLHQSVHVADNVFDLDPLFTSTNRGTGGTWLANGNPTAILLQSCKGFLVVGNVFRNLCRVSDVDYSQNGNLISAIYQFIDNIVDCDPTTPGGFNTGNKGVGHVPYGGMGFIHRIVDCDPASATFGTVKNHCPTAAVTIPTTGTFVRGHIVRRGAPTVAGSAGSQYVVTGWMRLTTGSGHVSGTDWAEMRTLTGT